MHKMFGPKLILLGAVCVSHIAGEDALVKAIRMIEEKVTRMALKIDDKTDYSFHEGSHVKICFPKPAFQKAFRLAIGTFKQHIMKTPDKSNLFNRFVKKLAAFRVSLEFKRTHLFLAHENDLRKIYKMLNEAADLMKDGHGNPMIPPQPDAEQKYLEALEQNLEKEKKKLDERGEKLRQQETKMFKLRGLENKLNVERWDFDKTRRAKEEQLAKKEKQLEAKEKQLNNDRDALDKCIEIQRKKMLVFAEKEKHRPKQKTRTGKQSMFGRLKGCQQSAPAEPNRDYNYNDYYGGNAEKAVFV